MSLFFKRETRSIDDLPWDQGGDHRQSVSEFKALHLAPVYAAIRHITDYGSTLPLKPYRRVGDAREGAPMPRLFRDLETRGELVPWLSKAFFSLAMHGNAVGLVARGDGMGFPVVVDWVPMHRVSVDDVTGVAQWYIDGRPVRRSDILHIPWITVPGCTLGLSPLEFFAATVMSGLEAQEFGNDWFASGGVPPSVFKNTMRTVEGEQAAKIRSRLKATIQRHEPLVIGNDWSFEAITIPPEQAQFIETQKLAANDIAAIYGIDPTEVGGQAPNSLTYSNEEHRQTRRAADMRPYLTRFEEAFDSWLPDRQYVRFNTDAAIRSDTKTRHEVYQIQHNIGLRSINEQRALEDLPPIPGGDAAGPPEPPAPQPEDDNDDES